VKGQTVKAIIKGIEESDDEMEVDIGQPKETEQNEVSTQQHELKQCTLLNSKY
jgi:hypothetical protein